MTTGPTDQPGQPYGQEGQQFPQQPGYPTPPPTYGTAPGYPGAGPIHGGFPPPPPIQYGPSGQSGGFFQALFDFNFNSYVTPKVVKVLYILLTVLVGLYTVFGIIAGFAAIANNGPAGILILIAAPLFGVVLLALMRIGLEFYVAVIKISEDVKDLKARP